MLKNANVLETMIFLSLLSNVHGGFFDICEAVTYFIPDFITPHKVTRGVNDEDSSTNSTTEVNEDEENLNLKKIQITWAALDQFLEKRVVFYTQSTEGTPNAYIKPELWDALCDEMNSAFKKFKKLDRILYPENYANSDGNNTEHTEDEEIICRK